MKIVCVSLVVIWCSNMVLASHFHNNGLNKVIKDEGEEKVNSVKHQVGRGNHFLNGSDTRDYCTATTKWPMLLKRLTTFLNTSQYLGLYPKQPNIPPLPTNQPTTCPTNVGSWWPGITDNLRSNCPWIYGDTDLGESFYPRYVQEAVCLCSTCVNANVMGCKYLRQNITVFQRVACKDGLAIMNAVTKNIVVGCYCALHSPGPGPIPPTE